MGLYALNCIRIPVRTSKAWKKSYLKGTEFRFGNESGNGNYESNPLIGFAHNDFMGLVVEYCVNFTLIGQFLIAHKNIIGENLEIPEIQITVF